ncbi:hypothetical protein [Methanobacterium sp.]
MVKSNNRSDQSRKERPVSEKREQFEKKPARKITAKPDAQKK